MDTKTEPRFYITKELDVEEHIFEVILERYPDGRYYTYCPSLKGCRTWGHSEEEALEYMQEALELYIEDLIADGKPIPDVGIVENIKPVIRVKEIKEAVL
ncbi:MAG: type II toxin-antitoxin system HicB family antitoxin [Candidatus Poribacteria bacterium]